MTLHYANDFSSSLATVLELQAFNTPIAGASAPAGIANRLFLNGGDLVSYIHEDDPETYGGIRSELRFLADDLNHDMWYVFDILLAAEDWVQVGTEEISIFQVHAHDAIVGTSINLSGVIIHGNLKIIVPIPEPPSTPITDNLKASYPMPFGRRVRIALHGYWKADDNGVIEVYVDRVPIFRQYNRGTAYTADHPYLKLGCYDTQHSAAFGFRQARYRNLQIWRGQESYTNVLGGRPARTRTPLVA